MDKHRKLITPEQVEVMSRLYPDHPNEEIASIVGISPSTIRVYVTRYGWRKSKEYMSRLNRDKALKHGTSHLNTPEGIAKRSKTRHEYYVRDKSRLNCGLPRKTRLQIRTESRKKMMQRNRLERRGYVIDNVNMIAYWTERTQRAVRLERIPRRQKKGSIMPYYDFRPISDKPEEK